MVKAKWADLKRLADMTFDLEMKKLAALHTAEANIVERRAKLRQMNDAALGEFVGAHPAHWQNGDFLWQTWIGRNVEELGREQARVRALAEIQKPEVRKAFGRKTALAEVMKR